MPTKNCAVITVHGVRWKTKDDWQTRFGTFIKTMDPDIKVFHFRFGYMLGVISWWLSASHAFKIPSWIRRHYVLKLAEFMRDLRKKFPDHEFSIVGHSFGGWLIEQALLAEKKFHVKNIVFIHCPISPFIEETSFWNWLEMGRVPKIYSWSSHQDKVIRAVALKPFGHNGYWGFMRTDFKEDRKEPLYQPYPLELYNIRTKENHFGILDNLDHYGQMLLKQLI